LISIPEDQHKEKTMRADEIQKGLQALQEAANGGKAGRRSELLLKASKSELSKAESDELIKSLSGDALATEATIGLDTKNDTLAKGVEASDFLRELHKGTVEGFRKLGEALEKSETQEHSFRKALASTLVGLASTLNEQNELVKSLKGEIDDLRKSGVKADEERIEKSRLPGAEARGPRSVIPQRQGAQPLNKSFSNGGQPGGGDDALNVEEISKSLIDMAEEVIEKSGAGMDDGNAGGVRAPCGESIAVAVSNLEQTGQISKALLKDVQAFNKRRSAA
jgi:hypothetical protein